MTVFTESNINRRDIQLFHWNTYILNTKNKLPFPNFIFPTDSFVYGRGEDNSLERLKLLGKESGISIELGFNCYLANILSKGISLWPSLIG